jgi:hypothetical protein
MNRRVYSLLASAIIFAGVFLSGFFLSAGKPLWLDEHYSLIHSVGGASYREIFSGRTKWEGNNSPLFYALQKALCDLVSYSPRGLETTQGRPVKLRVPSPDPKKAQYVQVMRFQDSIFYGDPFSNVYLRLISLFFMALAPASLFYFFALRYSMWLGAFSALLCMSSWLFWWYGFEARPYIHLFTLTVLQILAVLALAGRERDAGKLWRYLTAVNILLALVFTTSALQIMVAALCVWCYARPTINFQRLWWAFGLPAVIIGYYYILSIKTRYCWGGPLWHKFSFVMSFEALFIIALLTLYVALSWMHRERKWRPSTWLRWLDKNEHDQMRVVLCLAWILVFLYLLALLYVKSRGLSLEQGGAPWANRYLISLAPMGIVAMTFFGRVIVLAFRPLWVRACFIVFLAGLVAWRFYVVYKLVHYWIGI